MGTVSDNATGACRQFLDTTQFALTLLWFVTRRDAVLYCIITLNPEVVHCCVSTKTVSTKQLGSARNGWGYYHACLGI
jgi:hypothetical protein